MITFAAAQAELKALGIALKMVPGEYSVNYVAGSESTEYRTDDLFDALDHGRVMARNAPQEKEAPLGPMGRGSRKGEIYKHNKKLAAKRAKESSGG